MGVVPISSDAEHRVARLAFDTIWSRWGKPLPEAATEDHRLHDSIAQGCEEMARTVTAQFPNGNSIASVEAVYAEPRNALRLLALRAYDRDRRAGHASLDAPLGRTQVSYAEFIADPHPITPFEELHQTEEDPDETYLSDLRASIQALRSRAPKQHEAIMRYLSGGKLDNSQRNAKHAGLKHLTKLMRSQRAFRSVLGTWMERSRSLPEGRAEQGQFVHHTDGQGNLIAADAHGAFERDNERFIDIVRTGNKPTVPKAVTHWEKGLALEFGADSSEEFDAAIREYQIVRLLDPDFWFDASAQIAQALEARGCMAESIAALKELFEASVERPEHRARAASNLADSYMQVYARDGNDRHLRAAVEYSANWSLAPTPSRMYNAIWALSRAAMRWPAQRQAYMEQAAEIVDLALAAESRDAVKFVALCSRVQQESLQELWIYISESRQPAVGDQV